MEILKEKSQNGRADYSEIYHNGSDYVLSMDRDAQNDQTTSPGYIICKPDAVVPQRLIDAEFTILREDEVHIQLHSLNNVIIGPNSQRNT